jgi:hypothetical protein
MSFCLLSKNKKHCYHLVYYESSLNGDVDCAESTYRCCFCGNVLNEKECVHFIQSPFHGPEAPNDR